MEPILNRVATAAAGHLFGAERRGASRRTGQSRALLIHTVFAAVFGFCLSAAGGFGGGGNESQVSAVEAAVVIR